MGSKIELLRMTIYVFFPVAVFYYFNMPDFYEEYVQSRMKKLYPPSANTKKPPASIEELKAYEKNRKEQAFVNDSFNKR
ncbi:protein PET100 homolog, mitochondrial-like [Xenia sp. Carnegie-2017]|uniref:protein PET100 homolog, mitochondrial-like n=1 Tax=Xenia sp. Carnegie-2017 TaxID=2897299 RepID=UPI001F041BC4|nr:protein PET100 homolog, mitochondrial-like [Xenia sp. Carnegie-2017]XP_046851335.1 protein PET100 homolog, mitochondrial-like [Xenia sp. Carnegie-2017]